MTAIELATMTGQVLTVGDGTTQKPAALSVSATAAGDNIAIVDAAAQKIYMVGFRPGAPNPADRIIQWRSDRRVRACANRGDSSPGGSWLYVLERDAADQKGYIEPVDAHAVELKLPNPIGAAVAIGQNPTGLVLSPDGSHMYVAYAGLAPAGSAAR